MNAKEALVKTKEMISQGKEYSARYLLKYRLYPGQEAEDYFNWGQICEDLNLPKLAHECYEKAISKNPNNPRYILALAEVTYKLGELSKVVRLLRRLLQLQDSETLREFLAQVLEELGQHGAALTVTNKKQQSSNQSGLLRYFPPNLGYRELEPFFHLFRSRKIHGEVLLTSLGKTTITIKTGSITIKKLREHILGHIYLIYYPLLEDKTLTSSFLSIYISQNLIEKCLRNKANLTQKTEVLKRRALSTFSIANSWGLNPALERLSPFKYRLWFFFEEPIHFLWAKRFLETLKERLPLPEEVITYKAEIPTEGEGIGWREKGFELPLGIHPLTLERSLFLDTNGYPYPEQLEFIKRIKPISSETVREFCRKDQISVKNREYSKELKKLRIKCPIINHIIKRAEAGKKLSREEKIALFLTIGFLKNGKELVHFILSGTPDYNYLRIEKMLQSIPKNPISCDKLEIWFSNFVLDKPCACVFGKHIKERYPSPLIHVDPKLVPTRKERLSLTFSSPTELGCTYLRLMEKLEIVKNEIKSYLKNNPNKKIRCRDYIIILDNGNLSVIPRFEKPDK